MSTEKKIEEILHRDIQVTYSYELIVEKAVKALSSFIEEECRKSFEAAREMAENPLVGKYPSYSSKYPTFSSYSNKTEE